jgi:hypothetical protein
MPCRNGVKRQSGSTRVQAGAHLGYAREARATDAVGVEVQRGKRLRDLHGRSAQ